MSKQRTSIRDINARERMNMAVGLRKAGATLDQISAACGYGSRSSAHKAIRRAMMELPVENATELRALECLRLDELLLAYWPRAKKDINAAHLVLKIAEQRAKLLGLFATTESIEIPYLSVQEVPFGYLSGNGHVNGNTLDQDLRQYVQSSEVRHS